MSLEERDIDQLFKERLYSATSSFMPTQKEQVLDAVQASGGRTRFFLFWLILLIGMYSLSMEILLGCNIQEEAQECSVQGEQVSILSTEGIYSNHSSSEVFSKNPILEKSTTGYSFLSVDSKQNEEGSSPTNEEMSSFETVTDSHTAMYEEDGPQELTEEATSERVSDISKRGHKDEPLPMMNYSYLNPKSSRWSVIASGFIGTSRVRISGAREEGDLLRKQSESGGLEFGSLFMAERSFGSYAISTGMGFSHQMIDNEYKHLDLPVIASRDTSFYEYFINQEIVVDSVFEDGEWEYVSVEVPFLDSNLVNTTVNDTLSRGQTFLNKASDKWSYTSAFIPVGISKRLAGIGSLSVYLRAGLEFHYVVARQGSYSNVEGTSLIIANEDASIRQFFVNSQLSLEGRWRLKNDWYIMASPQLNYGLSSLNERMDYSLRSWRLSLGVVKRLGSLRKP